MWVSLPQPAAGSRKRTPCLQKGRRPWPTLELKLGRGRIAHARSILRANASPLGSSGQQARRHRPATRARRLRRAGRHRPGVQHRRAGPCVHPCTREPLRPPALTCREAGPRDVSRHREDRCHQHQSDRTHRTRHARCLQAGVRGTRGTLPADSIVVARVRVVREEPREELTALDPARDQSRAQGQDRPVKPLVEVAAGRVRQSSRVLRRRLT